MSQPNVLKLLHLANKISVDNIKIQLTKQNYILEIRNRMYFCHKNLKFITVKKIKNFVVGLVR